MGYVVIEHFCDMQDNSRAYSVGDKFPRDGYEVSQARLDILATGRNALGRPLIKVIGEKKTKEVAVAVSEETAAEPIRTPRTRKNGTRKKNN